MALEVPIVPLEPEGDYASPREIEPVRADAPAPRFTPEGLPARQVSDFIAGHMGAVVKLHERHHDGDILDCQSDTCQRWAERMTAP